MLIGMIPMHSYPTQICDFLLYILYLYLYSAQYLHVLQDSKLYMTHPTAQVQSNSHSTDIPLTEREVREKKGG